MNNGNIIKLEDVSQKKTISLKKAAEILGMSYHKARKAHQRWL